MRFQNSEEHSRDLNNFDSLFSNTVLLSETKKPNQAQLMRKLNDFKSSMAYLNLKNLLRAFDDLELRENDQSEQDDGVQNTEKFDFDTEKGYDTCKAILKSIEKVFMGYRLKINERSYR